MAFGRDRSERECCEQLRCNILVKWFLDFALKLSSARRAAVPGRRARTAGLEPDERLGWGFAVRLIDNGAAVIRLNGRSCDDSRRRRPPCSF